MSRPVELLARHEERQDQKDRALAKAVESKRLDMVEGIRQTNCRLDASELKGQSLVRGGVSSRLVSGTSLTARARFRSRPPRFGAR